MTALLSYPRLKVFAIIGMIIFQLPSVSAQDKIYLSSGKVAEGKVVEVAPHQIRVLLSSRPGGPLYSYDVQGIDSIIYADGTKENLEANTAKRDMRKNIPQLNSITFDPLCFLFYSVTLSYEHRLKNGLVGFRVPLYISYRGNRVAGEGFFNSTGQAYANGEEYSGYAIATGLNARFYLFKHRVIRAFVGPEVTIGVTRYQAWAMPDNVSPYYYSTLDTYANGTFAVIGKFGLMITPIDNFNMTIDGGVGIGELFGPNAIGYSGIWHVGFALGGNF